ncbi:MAG: alanine racemase [Acidobacteriota bacterium]
MLYSSCIELSKSSLHKNIRFLKEIIGREVEFSSVIKGNAYGHDIEQFLPLAEQCGIRHFSVYSSDEAALALKSRKKPSHICIMGFIANESLEWAVGNRISFYVFDIDRLKAAIPAARSAGRPARIHLELETGLNRTGFQGDQLSEAVKIIRENSEYIKIDVVCTHYAGSESINNYARILKQIEKFNELCRWLRDQDIDYGLRHTACSAAVLSYPQTRMDMVRIGIAQYGFWPSQETKTGYILNNMKNGSKMTRDPLRRVMTWKSKIMNIKDVEAGGFVGYGTSYLVTHDQRIASIPVGYHHGFARKLSNLGWVLVRGKRAPVVGTVNMHSVMVDVSRIKGACTGDEVMLIGRQNRGEITVGAFSDLTRFLNYEILARLPYNIPRVIVD